MRCLCFEAVCIVALCSLTQVIVCLLYLLFFLRNCPLMHSNLLTFSYKISSSSKQIALRSALTLESSMGSEVISFSCRKATMPEKLEQQVLYRPRNGVIAWQNWYKTVLIFVFWSLEWTKKGRENVYDLPKICRIYSVLPIFNTRCTFVLFLHPCDK